MINKLLFTFLISILLVGCNLQQSDQSKEILTVSIAPQKYFIERLIGDTIDVNIMIPQGSDHATYAPSATQIKKLSKSVAYLKMGHLGFESVWVEKIQSANPNLKWFDMSNGISTIHGDHSHHHHDHDHICSAGVDPHIWTSPKEVQQIIKNTRQYLVELFPEHKGVIASNYELLMSELDEMDERLKTIASQNPNMSFMIFHPAYTYLAQAYGFEQITIEFEGKTPTPGRLKTTIENAREKQIKTIYIQQEFDQSNALVIANEIGATTVQVNPLAEQWKNEMERFINYLEAQ